MKNLLACVVTMILAAGLAAPLAAQQKTIKGEVVDLDCYTKDPKAVGKAHEQCAISCARQGKPQGILAADGVYLIAGDYTKDKNAKLIEFVAKIVEAAGEVTVKDGQKIITVTSMKLAK
jgi:hypothetical protein